MRRALMLTEEERNKYGADAQRFIVEKKNSTVQAARILSFIEEKVMNEDKD